MTDQRRLRADSGEVKLPWSLVSCDVVVVVDGSGSPVEDKQSRRTEQMLTVTRTDLSRVIHQRKLTSAAGV